MKIWIYEISRPCINEGKLFYHIKNPNRGNTQKVSYYKSIFIYFMENIDLYTKIQFEAKRSLEF